MASDRYQILEGELAKAGAPVCWTHEIKGVILSGSGAVAALLNTGASAKPYVDLLLSALPDLAGTEQEMVVRTLSERGMPRAGPVLVNLMRSLAPDAATGLGWAIGNALATIRDPSTFDEVIALCTNRKLGTDRQMLFLLLPKIGTDAAYRVALASIDDDTVRGHALDALGRFGRPEAIGPIRAVTTKRGLYEDKAKATAIRRLERVLARRSPADA